MSNQHGVQLEPDVASAYLEWAIDLYQRKQFDETIDKCKKALDLNSRLSSAYYHWGLSLMGLALRDKEPMGKEKYAEADEKFHKAVELGENSAGLFFNWGRALRKLERYKDAIDQYEKASALRPDAAIYVNWGNALDALKRYDEAIEKYKKAIELDSRFALAYSNLGRTLNNKKEYVAAIEALRKAVELDSSQPPAYLSWGVSLNGLKKYDKAIEKFKKAIELDGHFAAAYSNWGNSLDELKKYDEAIEKYKKAIELDGHYALAYSNWGVSLNDLKKYDKAIEKFKKAIELDENYAAAYSNWGNSLLDQNRYQEAIEKYSKALELDEKLASAYAGWGAALNEQQKYTEAIEKLTKAISIEPDQAPDYLNWGNSLSNLKKYDEAVEKYKKAIELDDHFAAAYANWGSTLISQGSYDDAVEKFSQAVEIDPQFAFAYYGWGLGLAGKHKYEEAIEKYRKAIDADRDYAYAYHNIGYLFWKQGNYLRAREEWQRARDAYLRQQKANPFDAELSLYCGSMLDYLNRPDDAEAMYLDGLHLQPNDIRILTAIAGLYLDKFEDEETPELYWKARDWYSRAEGLLKEQSRSTTEAAPFLQLGSLYIRLENYEEAERVCKRVLDLDGHAAKERSSHRFTDADLADAYTNLGFIGIRRREYAAAIRYFESALRIDRDDLFKRSNLAEAYRKAEQLDRAEQEYTEVLKIAPEHLESLIGLGECYSAMADGGDKDLYEDAVTYFSEAIKSRRSISASKSLSNKDLANVYYSRGYARAKQYEASKFGTDGTLLQDALDDFKHCFKLKNNYKAKHAADRIEKQLTNSSPQQLAEKFGPVLIAFLALVVFLLAQFRFFGSHTAAVSHVAAAVAEAGKNDPTMGEGYYALLTFGSLLFMVTGLYLPQILKLKVGSIELEKSPVDHAAPSSSLGIKRLTA